MSGLMPPGILSYIGQVAVPYINRTFPPTTAFLDFAVPTVWIDTQAENAYILVSKALGVADWVPIGGTAGTLDFLTPDIGGIVDPVAGNINILGGPGVETVGTVGTITINVNGLIMSWVDVTGATQAMSVQKGYLANRSSQITFTLPATAAVGDMMIITGINVGGWTLVQNASQQIIIGSDITTVTTGSITATSATDTITLVCVVADTKFTALNWVGNLTVI